MSIVTIINPVLKNRDLADIIRDNSMCTMLLTSFARINGSAYIAQSLTQPLNAIFAKLSDCEVDIHKIQKETPEESQEQLEINRANLQIVCDTLFTHIFDNQNRMPRSMMRMCHFLEKMVAEIIAIRSQSVPSISLAASPSIQRPSREQPSQGFGPGVILDNIRKRSSSMLSKRDSMHLSGESLKPSQNKSNAGIEEKRKNSAKEDKRKNSIKEEQRKGSIKEKRLSISIFGRSNPNNHASSVPSSFATPATPTIRTLNEPLSPTLHTPPNSSALNQAAPEVQGSFLLKKISESKAESKTEISSGIELSKNTVQVDDTQVAIVGHSKPLSKLSIRLLAGDPDANLVASAADLSSVTSDEASRKKSGGSEISDPMKRTFSPQQEISSMTDISAIKGAMHDQNGFRRLSTASSAISNPMLGATRSMGVLSQTQKVVGSFLFLRFFVPGTIV
jgi:GTPase-activator protein for Ras-like GTPase